MPMKALLTRSTVLLCFCASGAAALICQVVWTRQLVPLVGATVHAVATVLAAFMGGLAVGGWLGGRWADAHPWGRLRAYALLEAMTAALALALPYAFEALPGTAYPLPWALMLLLVPTTLMGATMPVLTKFVTGSLEEVGGSVADLYAANTTGAMSGALLTSFFLIPRLGLMGSLRVAAALCLGAALLCWALPRTPPGNTSSASEGEAVREHSRAAIGLFALCGFSALALEVLWTRALMTCLGNSAYAFSVMLFTFLAGLALGGVLIGYVCDDLENPLVMLAAVVAAAGLVGLLARHALAYLPTLMAEGGRHAPSFGLYLLLQVVMSGLILLPQTLFFGAAFPLVVRLTARRVSEVGRAVGRAYFWNTLAGIAGSLTAVFVMLPVAGVQSSITAISVLLLLAGTGVLLSLGRRSALLLVVPALALLALRPPWDQAILLRGADMAYRMKQGRMFSTAGDWRVLYYREGRHATVVVGDSRNGERCISINGQVQASTNREDRFLQEAVGHLPMLFAPNRSSVLVIGMGSGMTAAAVARHQPGSLRLAELEPAVVAAGPCFKPWNAPLWSLPGLDLRFTDGRWLLAREADTYDVITSDPIHPLEAGASSLYTVEHFRNCRRRLSERGLMCQWLPLYGLSQEDARRVMGSFCEAFPQASLWCYYPSRNKGDAILLASKNGSPLSAEHLSQRLAVLQGQGVDTWRDEGEVLAGFVMAGERLREYAGGLRNTDDRPELEFQAPRSAYLWTPEQHRRDLATVLAAGADDLPVLEPFPEPLRRQAIEGFFAMKRDSKARRLRDGQI
jgi:spermidine synthase